MKFKNNYLILNQIKNYLIYLYFSSENSNRPLLKEKYASERKKAKTMNFSIAYGKSAHGFAKDWGCTIKEAKDALKA